MSLLLYAGPRSVLNYYAWQKRYFVLTLSTTDRGSNYKVLSYFKSAEDEEPLGNIPLVDIKSVNVSKDQNGRFDIIIKGRIYQLKVDSSADLQRWVSALSHTVAKPAYSKPANLPSSPAETMKLMSNTSPDNAKLFDTQDTLQMMNVGARFIKYDYDMENEDCHRSIVLVYLRQDDSTELGSLYWVDQAEKPDNNTRQRLALHELSDLYLGKQSKAFKHPVAMAASADRCFTAKANNIDLNLEGDSKEQVAAWLFGINAIMMTRGNRRVLTVAKTKQNLISNPLAVSNVSNGSEISPNSPNPLSHNHHNHDESSNSPPIPLATPASSSPYTPINVNTHSQVESPLPPPPFFEDFPALQHTQQLDAGGSETAPNNLVDRAATEEKPVDNSLPITNIVIVEPSPANPAVEEKSGLIINSVSDDSELSNSCLSPSSAAARTATSFTFNTKMQEVNTWLTELGSAFAQYYQVFVDNGIDMNFLMTCSDDDLEDLGVSRLHRKKMLHAIDELRLSKGLNKRDDIPLTAETAHADQGNKHFHLYSTLRCSFLTNNELNAYIDYCQVLLLQLSLPPVLSLHSL
jgi:hypothetical protein